MKLVKSLALLLMLAATVAATPGCVEHRYYHEHHRHSPEWYHRHHQTEPRVDVEIHH